VFLDGVYSKKVHKRRGNSEREDRSHPQRPTNGGRAFAAAGDGAASTSSRGRHQGDGGDIAQSEKNQDLRSRPAQIPRSLDDVDAAVINTNYAIVAGLIPTKDALVIEDADSPYANVIAVRTKDKDNPVFQRLLKAYRSPEVKQWIEEKYKGSIVPVW
jgi:D-methionine transport system substrate-binding protein